MSKRKEHTKSVCVLAVACKSELNDTESHVELVFHPTPLERVLLELYEHHPDQFAPAEYREVDSGSLANALVNKYEGGGCWEPGNPLSTAKEEDESDEDVVEFLRNRRETRRTNYDFVVETDYIPDDASVVRESFNAYLDFVKRELCEVLRSKDAKGSDVMHLLQRLDLIDVAREFCFSTNAKGKGKEEEGEEEEDSEPDV